MTMQDQARGRPTPYSLRTSSSILIPWFAPDNRFTGALLRGRLKFCFLHNAFYEIQRRRIPTFSDPTRLHGQVHGTCVSRVTCAVGLEFPV